MPLDRLPLSLQQYILLEWLSPSAVSAVARSGSTSLRRAVMTSPHPFRAAPREIVSDACVRWFNSLHEQERHHEKRLPLLVLWTTVEKDRWGGDHYKRNGKMHRDDDLPADISSNGKSKAWYQNGQLHRDNDLPANISACGMQRWYRHGKMHRDNCAPAYIRGDNNGFQWWENDKQYHPIETYGERGILLERTEFEKEREPFAQAWLTQYCVAQYLADEEKWNSKT